MSFDDDHLASVYVDMILQTVNDVHFFNYVQLKAALFMTSNFVCQMKLIFLKSEFCTYLVVERETGKMACPVSDSC